MRILALFLALLMLCGCVRAEAATDFSKTEAEKISDEQIIKQEEKTEEEPKEVRFVAPKRSSPKVAVMRYFSALYDSYIAMLPVDISPIIDLEFEMMENVLNWNNLLAMRRRLIAENDYCYVETERFDYEIEYIKKRDLDDERMDYVRMKDFGKNAVALHFVIKGEEGRAYPPIFALNSQHTVIITEEEGEYKIAYHYFPGSEGKFQNDLPVSAMTEKEMQDLLKEEFLNGGELVFEQPEKGRLYNGEAAKDYALKYCESRNKNFYFVGDWYGNCMNFASQCIWSGFKEEGETPKNFGGMTGKWYCGKSGGTIVWASVSRFWEWTKTESCKLDIVCFNNVNMAQNGDIVNIGSYACEEEDKYTHALIVADSEKMLLAQNSPACFVYYSDLANNYARFIRPISLDV